MLTKPQKVLEQVLRRLTCYWSDVFTLHAVLGNRWSITPTKKVILRSGSVRTTASSIITSGGYKLLAARRPAPVLLKQKTHPHSCWKNEFNNGYEFSIA